MSVLNGKILIVDDEPSIRSFLTMGLEGRGFTVYACDDGLLATQIAQETDPDIIILDVMLPGLSGYDLCEILKTVTKASILMLSAKDTVEDRITGLDLGADDYMVKPFSFRELLSRINARLRERIPQAASQQIGPFLIQDESHQIFYHQEELALSPTEYALLRYFLANPMRVLSKSLILTKVWNYDFSGDDNIVEVYVRYLRDKLGDKERTLIRTIRNVGYRLDLDVS